MARPTMPATSVGDVWGAAVRSAVFDVSDRVDTKFSVVVLDAGDPDPETPDPLVLYVRLAGGDTVPPNAPTSVAGSSITQTGFTVTWVAPSDNVGVTGYEVYVDDVLVGTPTGTSQAVTGRTAGTPYAVKVRAKDAAGNWGAYGTTTVTTTAAGGYTQHSVWGTTAPNGTWASYTDGSPNIETGNSFYRFGTGTGTYPSMRIVGGKIYKDSSITFPAGTVTMRWYINSGPIPTPVPASGFKSGGVADYSKTVDVSTLSNGWNTILLDSPVAMPSNGGVVFVTIQFNGNDDFYMINSGAKPSGSFYQALDGTKLCWSDDDTTNGYSSVMYKMGSTFGTASAGGASYGTDILVDEGA